MTAELLLELKDDHTLIVIEHDMDFVVNWIRSSQVLNEGVIMAEGMMREVQRNEEVMKRISAGESSIFLRSAEYET